MLTEYHIRQAADDRRRAELKRQFPGARVGASLAEVGLGPRGVKPGYNPHEYDPFRTDAEEESYTRQQEEAGGCRESDLSRCMREEAEADDNPNSIAALARGLRGE